MLSSTTTISTNPNSHQWKPSISTTFSLQTLNFTPKNHLSNPPFKSFKNTPKDSNFQQPIFKKDPPLTKKDLPVIIKRNDKNFKYFWDGNSLELVCVDSVDSLTFIQGFGDGIRKFVKIVRDFFIPNQVSENYISYVKWKFLHRVFSSALQVLATQAMFRAIGVGYARSLPSAAAMNWVLKEGLGRLSRCIYTACVGSAFDTNLKRVRFATSIMFSLSIGIELMTPVFPNCFLLLASIANIAKQISLACYLATGTAVHRSFALADNMGEVSAKAQIQTVCFDNLGLLLAASLNVMFKNNERLQSGLPFVVYPIFSAIDLCGIYQSLKHVHLHTLTKERLEIILDIWIECGFVPSPAEVSKLEGINLLDYVGRNKRKWSIRIGLLDRKRQIPLLTMLTMNSLKSDDFYFICLETSCGLRSRQGGILLSLREGARTEDIIMGLLQACYVRQALLSIDNNKFESISHSQTMKWLKLIQESKGLAQLALNTVQEQLISSSWASNNILLGTQEQARFHFVGETDSQL